MRRVILEVLVIVGILGGGLYMVSDYYQPKETNYRVYLYANDGHVIKTLDGKFKLKMKNGSLVVQDRDNQYLLTGTTVVETY